MTTAADPGNERLFQQLLLETSAQSTTVALIQKIPLLIALARHRQLERPTDSSVSRARLRNCSLVGPATWQRVCQVWTVFVRLQIGFGFSYTSLKLVAWSSVRDCDAVPHPASLVSGKRTYTILMLSTMHRKVPEQMAYRAMPHAPSFAPTCRHPNSSQGVHTLSTMAMGLYGQLTPQSALLRPRGPVISPAIRLHCSSGKHIRAPRRLAASTDHSSATSTIQSAEKRSNGHHRLNHQQLLDLGATFVKCWFTGIAKGPQAVEESLSSIMDMNATLMADRVGLLEDKQASIAVVQPSVGSMHTSMQQLGLFPLALMQPTFIKLQQL